MTPTQEKIFESVPIIAAAAAIPNTDVTTHAHATKAAASAIRKQKIL